MANDVADKTNSSNAENSLPTNSDQQKVPPLRIVLNTAGNQKSSTIPASSNNSQPTSIKREKSHDVKPDGTIKSGGRVRIKLGTGKHQSGRGAAGSVSNISSNNQSNNKSSTDSVQKSTRVLNFGQKQTSESKEDSTSVTYSHLRRITRRSQRAVQVVGTEDEESISSMTSLDENQHTQNNIVNSDNNNTKNDAEQGDSNLDIPAAVVSTSTTLTSSNATNGSTNAETPRRYKRRKCETSESQSLDCDSLFGLQNYKVPVQNSFELFKNIRKQVDKRLTSLSSVHPRTPHGFRDYMLTRGAYLLDGNKLGNGTNLFLGEDGGLHSVPIGKFHALRHNKVNYSVSSRAKVPLGLPVNSPLYDLFIEQEKERYKMRMQHIKEREKLTLSVEQEIMRVYNQAALAAVNQVEPFSACTMLKHQEIYNYLDSDGVAILSREDAQQERAAKPDGVRTRRRQHGQITPPLPTARRNSNHEDSQAQTDTSNKGSKKTENTERTPEMGKDETLVSVKSVSPTDNSSSNKDGDNIKTAEQRPDATPDSQAKQKDAPNTDRVDLKSDTDQTRATNDDDTKIEDGKPNDPQPAASTSEPEDASKSNDESETKTPPESKKDDSHPSTSPKSEQVLDRNPSSDPKDDKSEQALEQDTRTATETLKESKDQAGPSQVDNEQDNQSGETSSPKDAGHPFTEEDRQAYNKEVFLSQLQEIDDKWDGIRNELLIRHRNESESLHAIQKLEWEWKTKEIGACDVRITPIIDSTLVPKINIYQQDY